MKAAVIGSGAWGTTLAKIMAENGLAVSIWAHEKAIADEINNAHENRALLPGIALPHAVSSTPVLEEACSGAQVIVMVVASKFYGPMADRLCGCLPSSPYLLSATKGLVPDTDQRVSQVLLDRLPEPLRARTAVLSGPNLSMEIARRQPSVTVISSSENSTAVFLQKCFNSEYFRVYTNNDMVGTELGGILKNIIAIAAGAIDGMGLGDNAKSAVMVRGMVEITRFAEKMGARPETMYGLSGFGDLITTCSSSLSRNHHVGEHLGKGMKLKDILAGMTAVAEGVGTAKIIWHMAQKLGVDMPVTEQVYRVLFEDKPAAEALHELMTREAKPEM